MEESSMIASDVLRQLPLHEKIFVMETLWDELSQQSESLPVPHWHQDLLSEREDLIQSGEAKFEDWEKAKRDIRSAVQ